MSRSAQPPRGPPAFHAACLGLHQVRRCVVGLGGLPAFFLRLRWSSGEIEWWELGDDERRLRPFDFEFRFGVAGVRDEYHARNLHLAARTGRARVPSLFGFSDFYAPLWADETHGLFLYAGQFAREVPTLESIRQSWKAVSRRDAVDTDPLFLRWARACLDVDVLASEQVLGLREMGRILSQLAAKGQIERAQHRLQKLRSGLAPFAVNHEWVRSALDPDGLTRPPWGLDPHPDPRLVEELGLTLRPSLAAVLALHPSEPRLSSLERQVAGRRLQHHAVRLCRQFTSCLAAPLGLDRVLCAFALKPQLRGTRRERAFADYVRRLQRQLADEQGLRTAAGIGQEVVPGEGLGTSYQQSCHALAVAGERQLACLRYDDELTLATPPGRALLARAERVEAHFRAGKLEEASSEGRQLAAVVRQEQRDRLLESRPYLLWTLDRICTHLVQEQTVGSAEGRRLLQQFEDESHRVSGGSLLAEAFESQLAHLISLRRRQRSADRDTRLERATQWLQRHLEAGDPLQEAARRAGLAPSSFRRAFRRAHGVSFATWLREARLDLARNLLCHGDLPIARVAVQAGFGSVHTFIRQFRRRESMTPGAYRRRHLAGEVMPPPT